MAILAPPDEAAAIIAHYLRQLTQASGRRWTAHNEHDMQRLCELLQQAPDEPTDEIPPYARPQLPTRTTVVLDRAADSDPDYQRWLKRQADQRTTQRMINREQR